MSFLLKGTIVENNEPAALPNVLFRFDGAIPAGTGYTVTHTGVGGASAIDYLTSPFTGANAGPSLKVNAASNRSEIEITGMNIAEWDGHIAVNCWVEDHTLVQQVQVFAGTTGYGRFFLATEAMTKGTGTAPRNGFHSVACGPLKNANAGATWTPGAGSTFLPGVDTLNAIKLRITGDGVGTGASGVWVHSFIIVAKGRPTVIFTCDDCSSTWIANVLPVLSTYGITCSFGINTGNINGGASFLTSASVETIAENHDVYAHNVTNTPLAAPYDTADALTYAAAFKTALGTLGGIIGVERGALYHPWVQGISAQTAVDTMRGNGMRIGRMAGLSNHNVFSESPNGGLFDTLMQLRAISTSTSGGAQTSATFDQVKADCLKYGTLVVLMTHEVTDTNTGIETSPVVYSHICNIFGSDSRITKRSIKEFYQECLDNRLTVI